MRNRKFGPAEHKKRLADEKKDLNNRWKNLLSKDKFNRDEINEAGVLMHMLNCLDKRLLNENLMDLL